MSLRVGFPSALCSFLWITSLVSAGLADTTGESSISASEAPVPIDIVPRSIPANFPLKICCVGDSITVGVGDGYPTGTGQNNGYRLDLYNILTSAGYSAQFIGSQVSGTNNPQPDMEGYGWQTISSILNHLKNSSSLEQQPNLVLIHAGTNDMDYSASDTDPDTSPANAPYRLGQLIDYVNCVAPNAIVLVAQIIQNKAYGDGTGQANTNAFNEQVPIVVGERYMKGYKVRVIDLSMMGGNELSDWLHPTAAGYVDMANRWYSAIEGLPTEWWSTATTSTSNMAGSIQTCARDSISFSAAIDGNFLTDGFHVSGDTPDPPAPPLASGVAWVPQWGDDGIIAIGSGYDGGGVQFPDLNGDGRPDYIWVNYTGEGEVYAWLNGGTDVWTAVNNAEPIAFGYPGATYVEFADLDGDKLPELIIIADGQFRIWRNGGANGNVWSWNEMSTAESELNYIFVNSAPFHWFADITGSGRADLIVYDTNGVLDLYINDGLQSDGGVAWTQCKTIGIAPSGYLTFADIDGDGKADYVAEDSQGGLTGYLNKYTSGCSLGWSVINGGGVKSLDLGTGDTDVSIRLADFTGDGKADYLTVKNNGGAVHLYPNLGAFYPVNNTGIGGFGAAVRLNDMDGDGVDDYVTVTDYSGIAVYLNGGPGAGDNWTWKQQDDGTVIALGFPQATRQEVALADMNADGYADYLIVNTTNGELNCYLNLGSSTTGGWNWDLLGLIAIGIGGEGAGVRIADFDGDGKADYIYVNPDGSATVWLDKGPDDDVEGWTVINNGAVAALGVGAAPEDITFADIDGDGKADFCWIHPDTGALQVWYNAFDGTTVGWVAGGVVNPGQGYAGRNIRLARIGNSGRYDYVAVEEDNGAIKAWINDCSNVVGSKPRPIGGACGGPPLPTQTTSEAAPQPPTEVSIDSGGQTVIQGPNQVQVTLPFGITAATTITESNGAVITYISGGNTQATTIVNSAGVTIVQGIDGEQSTIPTGMTKVTTITESGGEVITYDPGVPIVTTTPTTTPSSNPAGGPTATTTSNSFIIFPITTYVPKPTASGSSQQIPCNLWFFFICISWRDIDIEGWQINFPRGTIIPPGPPPRITIPGITINTIGPMPTWPAITIGDDGIPTFTPTTEPDGCETETGSICMTSTSYGVSAGSTTTTDVLATCSVVYGCNPTESSTETTTTYSTGGSCPSPTSVPFTLYTNPITLTYPGSGGAPATTTTLIPPKTLPPTNAASGTVIPTDTSLNPNTQGSLVDCSEGDQEAATLTYAQYQNVTTAFCNQNLVLTTGQTGVDASIDQEDVTVVASVTWALDQTGCSARADYSTSSSNHNDANYQACLTAFLGPFQCNGVQNPAFDSTSLGGSYVYKSPNNGCLQYELGAQI